MGDKEKIDMKIATGRATCRVCGQKILMGSRDLTYWAGQGQQVSHAHPTCILSFIRQEVRRRL